MMLIVPLDFVSAMSMAEPQTAKQEFRCAARGRQAERVSLF
jgi:hypothetical protein